MKHMRKVSPFIKTLILLVFLAACQKETQETNNHHNSVITPMKDFLSRFKTHKHIEEALKIHGTENLNTRDMGSYDLRDPEITDFQKQDDTLQYTVRTVSGMYHRVYVISWKNQKIVSVKLKGVYPAK
jgi:hypothetical protein